MLVASIKTNGTITKISKVLKAHKPDLHIITMEPENSAVLASGPTKPHMLQEISANFIPNTLNTQIYNKILGIANKTALKTTHKLTQIEKIPVEISSNTAITTALEVNAQNKMAKKLIIIILPSFTKHYLSTTLFKSI